MLRVGGARDAEWGDAGDARDAERGGAVDTEEGGAGDAQDAEVGVVYGVINIVWLLLVVLMVYIMIQTQYSKTNIIVTRQ